MRGYYDLPESPEDTPAPYVRVRVHPWHTGHSAELDFLVDTGAYATVLHPDDVDRMGIDVGSLVGRETQASGIGGSMSYISVDAVLSMYDGQAGTWRGFPVRLDVSTRHSDADDGLPSLLGRDVLNRCNCNFDARERTVTLEPYGGL